MKFCVLILFLGLVGLSAAAITREGIRRHLVNAFSKNRYFDTPDARMEVISYIKDIFHFLADNFNGLVESQNFPVNVTFNKKAWKVYPGENIMLVLKGSRWGTADDQVSILGAHYDSQIDTYGVNDNGAAMSVMLEVARELTLSSCTRLNSVMFVAIDWEEFGYVGSYNFVNKYLVPHILEKFHVPRDKYRGAFIMDTIMNYDSTPNSQFYPPILSTVSPKMFEWLKARDFAGNFLLTIGRQDDSALLSAFSSAWKTTYGSPMHNTGPFDQLNIELPFSGNPSDSPLRDLIGDALRSDHQAFWECDNNYTNNGLEAVFLTDSANFRGYMKKCYHHWCDDMSHVTTPRLDFLRVITTTLTQMYAKFTSELNNCLPRQWA